MGTGWTCVVLGDRSEVQLEQLDDAGLEWCADGPGGTHLGALGEVLAAALGCPADVEWLALVVATIDRDRLSLRRSMVLVKRAEGTWFHATFSANRASISPGAGSRWISGRSGSTALGWSVIRERAAAATTPG
jgi:hypothetical protein